MHVAALSDVGDLSGVPRSRPQGRGRASQCKRGRDGAGVLCGSQRELGLASAGRPPAS